MHIKTPLFSHISLRNKIAGFSLVEVLVAFSILAFGLLALTRLQILSFKAGSFAEQQAQAINLAQETIEQFRSFKQLSGTEESYQEITSSSKIVTGSSTDFTLNWQIAEYTSPPYKEITVTTSWTDRGGTNHSVNLASIIGKIDPAISGQLMQIDVPGNIAP
jgi:type IV pilus modification protein PilV